MKLVLASGSDRRKELLSWLEIPFEVMESGVDETILPDEETSEAVARLALVKARTVAKQLEAQRIFADDEETGLVIGADTLVSLADQPIGKPVNRQDAGKIIKALSGKTHEVWTGVCLWDADTGEHRVEVEKTLVKFNHLSDAQIEKYLETKEWEGKAGAYMIQGEMVKHVANVEGSFTNVIGLPLETLQDMLESMGVFVEVDLRKVVSEKTGYEK
jgi:septum formation protein